MWWWKVCYQFLPQYASLFIFYIRLNIQATSKVSYLVFRYKNKKKMYKMTYRVFMNSILRSGAGTTPTKIYLMYIFTRFS